MGQLRPALFLDAQTDAVHPAGFLLGPIRRVSDPTLDCGRLLVRCVANFTQTGYRSNCHRRRVRYINPCQNCRDFPLRRAFRSEHLVRSSLVALFSAKGLVGQSVFPAATAVGSIHPDGREKALQCGANVIMPSATPKKYRELYQIYPNRIYVNETPFRCNKYMKTMIESLGRKVSTDYGHSHQFNRRSAGT